MIPLSAVPRRVLGRTGLQVSVLGFGTAPLGDLYAKLDDATAIAAAERAFELGINLLDTSPLYGRGLSEHRCGTAIRRVPRRTTGFTIVATCRPNSSSSGVNGTSLALFPASDASADCAGFELLSVTIL